MAANNTTASASHGNGRYLATSFALHMILFSAITFLIVEEEIITAKPLPTSVSVMLVDAREHCPFKTESPSEAKPIKPIVQKATPIPTVSKSQPVVMQKPVAQPVQKAQSSEPVSAPSISEPIQATPAISAPTQNVAVSKPAPVAKAVEESVTPAIFNAAYLNNPKPHYPKISKRLGEEGIVVLKVRVLADGTAGSVAVLKSSEYERLDNCALEAVKQWKFVAAKKGDKAVESWVSVPVAFKLDS